MRGRFIILFLLFAVGVNAQQIAVKSFRKLDSDLSALENAKKLSNEQVLEKIAALDIQEYGLCAQKLSERLEAAVAESKEEGKEKTILFNLSGHGMIDLYAYEQYFAGNLQNYTIPDSEITCSLKDLEKII